MESYLQRIAVIFLACSPVISNAETLEIRNLPEEYCSKNGSQHYWYRRIPPYVGLLKGEDLGAGGDGTCVLGFPESNSKSGYVAVNNKIIKVFQAASGKNERIYLSKNQQTQVQLSITGTETTCNPDEDKCCGDYTYAKVKIKQNGQSVDIRAVSYVGG